MVLHGSVLALVCSVCMPYVVPNCGQARTLHIIGREKQRPHLHTFSHPLSLTHAHIDCRHAQKGLMVFSSPLKQADSSMKMSIHKKSFYRWAVNEPEERGDICEKAEKELKQHGGKAVLIVNAGPRIPRAAAALSLP